MERQYKLVFDRYGYPGILLPAKLNYQMISGTVKNGGFRLLSWEKNKNNLSKFIKNSQAANLLGVGKNISKGSASFGTPTNLVLWFDVDGYWDKLKKLKLENLKSINNSQTCFENIMRRVKRDFPFRVDYLGGPNSYRKTDSYDITWNFKGENLKGKSKSIFNLFESIFNNNFIDYEV